MEHQDSIQIGILQTNEARLVARPYLQITTAGVIGLGLLGGWAGTNWLTVLGVFAVLVVTIVGISRNARLKGARRIHVYASAAINLTASAIIVMITGGPASPFWLLFLVGSLASALSYRGVVGANLERLIITVAALALFAPQMLDLPPEGSLVALAAMELLVLFMSGRMIRSIFSLLLESREKLSESDERYRRLVERALDVIFTISTEGRITSINPAFEAFAGWPREQWVGAAFEDLLDERDREPVREQFSRILSGETLRALRLRVRSRQGETLVVEMNLSPQIRDGQVLGLLGIARDVTQEQRAQDALSASERRFRILFENNPHPMWVYDLETLAFLEVNETAVAYYGYSREEFLRMTIKDIRPPGEIPSLLDNLARASQKIEWSGPWKHLTRDGSEIDVEIISHDLLLEGRLARLVLANDITERRRAEGNLRTAEAKYRNLVEHIPAITYSALLDDAKTRSYVSPQIETLLGYTQSEYLADPNLWRKMLHPDDVDRVLVEANRFYKSGEAFVCDYRSVARDGRVLWFHDEAVLYQDEVSHRRFIQGIKFDITERKQVEAALHRSEEKFSLMFAKAAFAAVLSSLPSGVIVDVNESFERSFGYSRQEVIGRTSLELGINPDAEGRAPILEELQRRDSVQGLELSLRTKPGGARVFLINLDRVEIGGEQYLLTTAQDITERKSAEEEVRRVSEIQSKLFEASSSVTRHLKLELVVQNIVEAAREAVMASQTNVMLIDEKGFCHYWQGAGYPEPLAAHLVRSESKSIDVMRSGRPVFLENFAGAPDADPRMLAEGISAAACLPLKGNDASFGVMWVNFLGAHQFSHTEQNILQTFANQAAFAIENARLFSAEQRRRREAAAIAEVGRNISESLQLEVVLERIANYAKELLAAETSAVYLAEPSTSALRAVAALGPDSDEIKNYPLRVGAGILGGIALQKSGEIVNDTSTDPRAITIQGTEDMTADENLMGVPVLSRDQLIGLIAVWRIGRGQEFTSTELEFLSALAGQVAVAIENARLFEEIRQLNLGLEAHVASRTAELSQANTLLQAMLDYVPDQVFFKDLHCRFIRNSRAQANLMGLDDPAEVVGKSDFDFFPHAERAYAEEQAVITSGQPLIDYEEFVVWPDGHSTWVSTTKVPLRDQEGQIMGIFGIARDITSRKQAQEALRKAKDEAEAASKELDAFSYSVSHDLRAPLRSIDGFARILVKEYGPDLPAEARGYLSNILHGSRQMGQLIEDLLKLSRVTRQALRHETVDLCRLARTIVAGLSSDPARRGVRFTIGDELITSGDPGLLHVVMENLLNNAWKYTSKREQAWIEVGSTPHADGSLAYFVRDNGAGFDMAHAANLFGPFQRLHPESEFEGTGIGLATVQRIINRHGGRVWAEAEVDKGATFFFTLG